MGFSTFLDNLVVGARSGWRARERGLAIFVGVFLSTLVLTSIFAYGTGLMSFFINDSINQNADDATIHFYYEPGYDDSTRTNNSLEFEAICDPLLENSRINDCSLAYGTQKRYSNFPPGNQMIEVQRMVSEGFTGQENSNCSDINTCIYENSTYSGLFEPFESGDESGTSNGITIFGESALEGILSQRYSSKVKEGAWFSNNQTVRNEVILMDQWAYDQGFKVGDTINLTFNYVNSTFIPSENALQSAIESSLEEFRLNCQGNGTTYEWYDFNPFTQTDGTSYATCRQSVTLESVVVVGIYQTIENQACYYENAEWEGRETISCSVWLSESSIPDTALSEMMLNDHAHLLLTLDRNAIPLTSAKDATKWLEEIEKDVEGTASSPQLYNGLRVDFNDHLSSNIAGLNIFVIFIQGFSFTLMIPVMILSMFVLFFGMNLALEQRKDETGIHRVFGATKRSLLSMILAEILVVGTIAFGFGLLAGLFTGSKLLDVVGFMEFEKPPVDVSYSLGLSQIIIIFFATVITSLAVGSWKTNKYLNLELQEAIDNEQSESRSNLEIFFEVLCVLFFVIGLWTVWLSYSGAPFDNFKNALFFIFGPILLWIGGAPILARLSGSSPKFWSRILGRTRLLSDISIGLRPSNMNKSLRQLGLIVILTMSIVTMSAVQGIAGNEVDKQQASSTVGADLQINLKNPMNQTDIEILIDNTIRNMSSEDQSILSNYEHASIWMIQTGVSEPLNFREQVQVFVVSNNYFDVIHWNEQSISRNAEKITQFGHQDFYAGGELEEYLGLCGGIGSNILEDDFYCQPHSPNGTTITLEYRLNPSPNPLDYPVPYPGNLSTREAFDYDCDGLEDNPITDDEGEIVSPDCTFIIEQPTSEQVNWTNNQEQWLIDQRFTTDNLTINYLGRLNWLPSIPSASNSLMIVESTFKELTNRNQSEAENMTMVFVEICDEQNTDCAKALTRLSAKLALNNSVSSANDWNSAYDVVKRNSGLIFGTPGLFSLQYVIAAISSIAACLVFLSLILSQRTKEMAIIQSIGGSRNQLGRLVIFEVMSVFITGLFLGGLLGFGLSLTFNGFFNVFGWLFQAAGLPGGSIITRELSWPISTLVSANGIIVICVSVSLTYALLKAISRDLVSALKED